MITPLEIYREHVENKLAKNGNNFNKLSQINKVFNLLDNSLMPIPCYVFPNKYGIMNYRARISKLKRMYNIPIENKRKVEINQDGTISIHSDYCIEK